MEIIPIKVIQEKYRNPIWGFSISTGNDWYEPRGLLWIAKGINPSTFYRPLFRHVEFPIQTNIAIGPLKKIPSIDEQKEFAHNLYRHAIISGDKLIEVLGVYHYVVDYLLVNRIPTRKYSLVFSIPEIAYPIEFVFTTSVYLSVTVFYEYIHYSDILVTSFNFNS
jgi:hypothetical protein